jgi:hypothetical protein
MNILKVFAVVLVFLLYVSKPLPVMAEPAASPAAESTERIVTLNDGAIYRGELLEYVPQSHVVLRLATGQVKRFEWRQIDHMSRPVGGESAEKLAPLPRPGTSEAVEKKPQPPEEKDKPLAVEKPVKEAKPEGKEAAAATSSEPLKQPKPAARSSGEDTSEKFYEHMRKGKALLDDDQLTPALKEFELAYAVAPKPGASYYIARIHHKIGDREIAVDWYQKYLKDASAVEPDRKAQIEKYIQELAPAGNNPAPAKALVPPLGALPNPAVSPDKQPIPPPPLFHYELRRNRGMMIAGATLLGLSYAATAITGIVGLYYGLNWSQAQFSKYQVVGYPTSSIDTLRNASETLLIPVAGPFVSAALMGDASWALPMAILGGGAQLAGLALTIAGSIKHRVPVYSRGITIVPYRSIDSSGLVMFGSF